MQTINFLASNLSKTSSFITIQSKSVHFDSPILRDYRLIDRSIKGLFLNKNNWGMIRAWRSFLLGYISRSCCVNVWSTPAEYLMKFMGYHDSCIDFIYMRPEKNNKGPGCNYNLHCYGALDASIFISSEQKPFRYSLTLSAFNDVRGRTNYQLESRRNMNIHNSFISDIMTFLFLHNDALLVLEFFSLPLFFRVWLIISTVESYSLAFELS